MDAKMDRSKRGSESGLLHGKIVIKSEAPSNTVRVFMSSTFAGKYINMP